MSEPTTDRTQVQTHAPTVTRESLQGFPTISGYEILRELGRGGMGVVYEAKQQALGRVVAIKLMQKDDGLHQARFLAEGQIIAALKHPNVVEVHDFGESSAGPFIAMEYLPGGTFGARLRAEPKLAPRESAELIAQIAAGVGAAHANQIVHRDLKPGNVLLDAHGVPKVTDFGLAKRTDFDLTLTHEAAGTPSYMAPEQARAMKFVGPPADVWSLGVMLYEALTGRKPFVADTDAALLVSIQNDNPQTLRTISKSIPSDLETICLKCLEKEPERRYATAEELSADLRSWLEGKPIVARRATSIEKAILWVRRKPAVATSWAFGLLAVVLSAFALTAGMLWQKAEREKGVAETLKGVAEEAREIAEGAKSVAEKAKSAEEVARKNVELEREKLAVYEYGRTMRLAHQEWRNGNMSSMRGLLDNADPNLRGWEWNYLNRLYDPTLKTVKIQASSYTNASFHLIGSRVVNFGKRDGTATICDMYTGAELLVLKGHAKPVTAASFSRDGTRIVTGSSDNTSKVWDAKTGIELLTFTGHTNSLTEASFSPDGTRVISVSYDKTAKVWDAKTGAVVITLQERTGYLGKASFSPDGTRVLAGNTGQTAKIWDAKTGAELLILSGHEGNVTTTTFNRDGTRALTGSQDETAIVWDAMTGKILFTLRGHQGAVTRASFDPDGTRIVTCSMDHTSKVWDALSGAELLTLRGHKNIQAAFFDTVGARVITASGDESLGIWDASTGAENRTLSGIADKALGRRVTRTKMPGPTIIVYSARFNSAGTRVVAGSFNKSAIVWNAKDWGVGQTLKGHANNVTAVSYNQDDSQIITGSLDKTAKIFDSAKGTEVLTLSGHDGGIMSVSFNAEGTRVLTGSIDKTAKLWNSKTGAPLVTFEGHSNYVRAAAFSPDGARVVTGCEDGSVKTWDANTGNMLKTFIGHVGKVFAASFSPDGTRVMTSGEDKSVKIWDAFTGAEILNLSGHTNWVSAATFSRDGKRVVTGSYDRTAKIWDARFGVELLSLDGHFNSLLTASFSSDGKRVLTGGYDGTVMVWDSRPFAETSTISAMPTGSP
jgi:WD40 repeat protein